MGSGTLGPVDSLDSPLAGVVIQDCFWEAALGVMDRLVLSDDQWAAMSGLIIGRPDQRGSTGRDKPDVRGMRLVDRAYGLSMARPARGVRRVEQRLPALQPVEREGHLAAHL
jgi:hypothetical protein